MFTYSDACTVGMGLILSSTSFIIGVFYANQAYDYRVLFHQDSTQADFDDALKHYQILYKTPLPVLVGLGTVATIGLIGHLIRIYKPREDLRNFEYGSLGLYFFGVCVCLSNIKTGVVASVTHVWGEVDENQGLAVLASSNIILILFFVGVIMLQGGLWYTRWEHQGRLKQFYEEEAKANAKAKAEKVKKEAQKVQDSEKSVKADAEKSVKADAKKSAKAESEKVEEIKTTTSAKIKADPKVHKAEETYEKKVKPVVKEHKDDIGSKVKSAVKEHKDDISSRVKSRHTKRKE